MTVRLLVLGWDSATFDVIDPLLEQGRLPVLAGMIERGFRAPLESTWPPMTDSAWTSAFTGCNPGRHGIFGSWYRAPGAYACRYFSARDRVVPALWDLTDGINHLVWNVPMTFPPERVEGAMVAGYGAPPGARFCEPAGIQDELGRRWPVEDLLDRAPHGSLDRFLADLLRGLEAQAEAIAWTAKEMGADAVSAVWPQVDRAQHFFWRFRGTDHHHATAIDRVYEAMDRATGVLLDAFSDANVLVISDHGAGSLRGDVNLGAWLTRKGHAASGKKKASRLVDTAWALPPALRRVARRSAPGLARRLMGATLTGALAPFDWPQTRAFVGFHGDLWLNLQGREPKGPVTEAEAPGLVEELRGQLTEIKDEATGERVFAAAHARAELFSGPMSELAPDLMLDSWSNGYRIAPNRDPQGQIVARPTPLAGVNEAWSSDHRPIGVWVAAGPDIATGSRDRLSLYDLCPTALALLGQRIPNNLDGEPAQAALTEVFLRAHPITRTDRDMARRGEGEFSDAEAAAVAEHLKDLGYIE